MSTLLPRAASRLNAAGLAVCLAFACCGAAHAQWAWRDASGNTTYSDSPPPPDIKPTDILRRPYTASVPDASSQSSSGPSASYSGGDSRAEPGTSQPSPPPVAAPPKTQQKSYAEMDADFRKRMAEKEKAEEKQAQDEAHAQEKADQCAQARGYLQSLQQGTRILRPDADGNRNFLDDDQRAAEEQKAQDNISKNCS